MLREIVVVSMTQLETVIEAAERADTDDFFFNPIGDPHPSSFLSIPLWRIALTIVQTSTHHTHLFPLLILMS